MCKAPKAPPPVIQRPPVPPDKPAQVRLGAEQETERRVRANRAGTQQLRIDLNIPGSGTRPGVNTGQ